MASHDIVPTVPVAEALAGVAESVWMTVPPTVSVPPALTFPPPIATLVAAVPLPMVSAPTMLEEAEVVGGV